MYERILVPLDGSLLAEIALDHASELARRFEAQLVLLRVVSPVYTSPGPGDVTLESELTAAPIGVDFTRIEADASAAGEYLEALRAKMVADGVATTTRVLEGLPAPEILDYAEAAGISLIVMSTHGQGALRRAAFGSVAGSVLSSSRIPVQIIPSR